MNQTAFKKREIYQKLSHVTAQDLNTISLFIDFLRFKETEPPKKRKIIKLQGLWRDYEGDIEHDVKELRKHIWKHVDEELIHG